MPLILISKRRHGQCSIFVHHYLHDNQYCSSGWLLCYTPNICCLSIPSVVWLPWGIGELFTMGSPEGNYLLGDTKSVGLVQWFRDRIFWDHEVFLFLQKLSALSEWYLLIWRPVLSLPSPEKLQYLTMCWCLSSISKIAQYCDQSKIISYLMEFCT